MSENFAWTLLLKDKSSRINLLLIQKHKLEQESVRPVTLIPPREHMYVTNQNI